MIVHRLVGIVKLYDGLKTRVRWRGLPESENTVEPLEQVYQDVPLLLKNILRRKNNPPDLVDEASCERNLS